MDMFLRLAEELRSEQFDPEGIALSVLVCDLELDLVRDPTAGNGTLLAKLCTVSISISLLTGPPKDPKLK